MKTLQIISIIIFSFLTISTSCDSDKNCPTATVASTELTDLECFNELPKEIGDSKNYIVNSNETYKSLFCNNLQVVDFNSYTLLAGCKTVASCSSVVSQEVKQTCNGYTYFVKVREDYCSAVTTIYYNALIPKISDSTPVKFEVEYIK